MTTTRYPALIIFFHWLVAALVLSAITLVWLADDLADKELQRNLVMLHKSVGISILVVMVLRMIVTLPLQRPAPEGGSRLMQITAKSVHMAFYGLLLVIPLLGWWMSSAAGKPVSWFFLVELPSIAPLDMPLAKAIKEWHEDLAGLLILLIGLHAGAALWHHYVNKDNTLRRMLPSRKD
ncbi:MAG: cytochrome b [Paraperlucidibaca sp.]